MAAASPDNGNGAQGDLPPFGVWLAEQIKERGWTQAEFARQSDIPEPTVGLWIREKRGVSLRHIERIAAALKLPRNAVLRALTREEPTSRSEGWQQMVAWMDAMPDTATEMDEFTMEELMIVLRFTTRLLDMARRGSIRGRE